MFSIDNDTSVTSEAHPAIRASRYGSRDSTRGSSASGLAVAAHRRSIEKRRKMKAEVAASDAGASIHRANAHVA
jgi:hypothetical protein